MEIPTTKPYLVALQDARHLPTRDRIEAEVCFARWLEQALGGEDAVASGYRAWLDACDREAGQLDAVTDDRAVRWPRAVDRASREALSKMGEVGAARFEIRLAENAPASNLV